MRTNTDALRSLKKYVASSLGEGWEVRLTGEDGAFKRPFARVGTSTPGTDSVVGSRMIEKKQTFNILAYPIEKAKPEEARLEAERIRDVLLNAFSYGTHAPSMVPSRYRAHPRRIPLYDYDGIAFDAAATEDDRQSNDYLRIVGDPTVTPVPDPEDELLWVITGEVTLWWTKSVAAPFTGNTVTSVNVEVERDVEV